MEVTGEHDLTSRANIPTTIELFRLLTSDGLEDSRGAEDGVSCDSIYQGR